MDAQHIVDAQSLFLQGRLPAARELYSRILLEAPAHVDALLGLGLIAQQEREPDRALAYLSDAARLAPTRADVLANLGNLLRAMERREEALECLERAAKLAPGEALIHINLGLVRQDLQQLGEAEAAFRTALAVQPGLAAAHQNLGHLLMLSDLKEARKHLIRALQLNPGMHGAFKDLCAVLVSSGEPEPALALCTKRLQRSPEDQDALAIMAIALRELGRDAEAQRLVDCDVWLKAYALEAPAGYGSIHEFNAALEAHVRGHPKLTSVLFGQATHNGMRVNDLLEEPRGPVAVLEQVILRQIREFWNDVPRLPGHPLGEPAMPARVRLRSWAVLMQRHGFETPHIHPDGLVSGVYYVSLPDVVAGGASSQAGWIDFGVPDPVYATHRPVPTRPVQPVVGTMLLFPSYVWHRTIPFDSAQERLSIAFDLTRAQ